jgi:hypothetical protein
MPGENILDWSTTAASNSSADSSVNWAEGQARASVNNSARSMMAAVAKKRNLENYSITTGGSANAQTFTSGVSYTSVPTGIVANLTLGATNTGSTTLNMDGIGAVTIKNINGDNLVGGELVSGRYADFFHNGTNWIYLGPRERVYTVAGETTGSSTAAIAFTSLPTGIKELKIRIYALQPATDATTLCLQFSTDNGATFLNGASDYGWQNTHAFNTTVSATQDGADVVIQLASNLDSAGSDVMGEISVFFKASGRAFATSTMHYVDTSSNYGTTYAQGYTENTCNAVQLSMSTGDLTSITYSAVAILG